VSGSWPKDRPPATVRALERWVSDRARETGEGTDALRRGISAMVLAGILGRATDQAGVPLVLVKGGTHMRLRFGASARPSKDLDVAVAEDATHLDRLLADACREPHLGFDATPEGPTEPVRDTGAVRVTIKLTYQGAAWGSVKIEAAANEAPPGEVDLLDPAPDLGLFGFRAASQVPCLPARFQIAQKLHAVTEIWEGRDNDRVRDLIDLQLLAGEVDAITVESVRAACIHVFERRGLHAWPPQVRVYPGWDATYRALAERIRFPVADVHEAAANVATLIAHIDLA